MNKSFTLDRTNGRLMGVCAGLANYTGLDVLVIRMVLIALTLFALGPVAVAAYLLTAWLAAK